MDWKPEHTFALLPIGAAVVASVIVTVISRSTSAGQWAAIIGFFGSLPFVVSRLMDRAK